MWESRALLVLGQIFIPKSSRDVQDSHFAMRIRVRDVKLDSQSLAELHEKLILSGRHASSSSSFLSLFLTYLSRIVHFDHNFEYVLAKRIYPEDICANIYSLFEPDVYSFVWLFVAGLLLSWSYQFSGFDLFFL